MTPSDHEHAEDHASTAARLSSACLPEGSSICRYCGCPPTRSHVYGKKKCCPDCDHRPRERHFRGDPGCISKPPLNNDYMWSSPNCWCIEGQPKTPAGGHSEHGDFRVGSVPSEVPAVPPAGPEPLSEDGLVEFFEDAYFEAARTQGARGAREIALRGVLQHLGVNYFRPFESSVVEDRPCPRCEGAQWDPEARNPRRTPAYCRRCKGSGRADAETSGVS